MIKNEPENEEGILTLKRDFRADVIDLQNTVQLVNMFENKDFFEHEDLFRVQFKGSSIHESLRKNDLKWKEIAALITKVKNKIGLQKKAKPTKSPIRSPKTIEKGQKREIQLKMTKLKNQLPIEQITEESQDDNNQVVNTLFSQSYYSKQFDTDRRRKKEKVRLISESSSESY